MTELSESLKWQIFEDRVQSLMERWSHHVQRAQNAETAIKGFLIEVQDPQTIEAILEKGRIDCK